jgi:hypothetical protein
VEFLETVVEDIVATDPEDPEALVFEVPWLAAGVGAELEMCEGIRYLLLADGVVLYMYVELVEPYRGELELAGGLEVLELSRSRPLVLAPPVPSTHRLMRSPTRWGETGRISVEGVEEHEKDAARCATFNIAKVGSQSAVRR